MNRVVQGTVRRNSDGTWHTLEDTEHASEGVDHVTADSGGVTVWFTFTGTKILSGGAWPDETLAKSGIGCGPSIGLDHALIVLGKNNALLSPSTITNASANIWFRFELECADPE